VLRGGAALAAAVDAADCDSGGSGVNLSGKRIFVTGGSGFVGGRLVETLVLDQKAQVRALVHRAYAGALRMARFNVEFAYGDITDPEAMRKATEGCDVVFHLAYGRSGSVTEQTKVTVEGTRALAQAALANKVSRFVNVSTAAVYFGARDGVVDETSRRRRWGWAYSDAKLQAEDVVLEHCRRDGLPGTVLQVAGVYGPWGETFTIGPLMQLRRGRVVLVNSGEGVSNATYVDDVVQALLLGAVRPEAIGEIFIIKGRGRVTRREMYERYETMLGVKATLGMTPAEIRCEQRRQRWQALRRLGPEVARALGASPSVRAAVRGLPVAPLLRVIWHRLKNRRQSPWSRHKATNGGASSRAGDGVLDAARPLIFPPDFMIPYYAAQVELSARKAERMLGFSPCYDLHSGMRLTEAWARWARLIP
jgi:nucleoside-diphosphate-sugar epimerase